MSLRVAHIIPFFGHWPEWIELYLYSCGRNPMMDFIFYTDCPLPKHRYKNTIFHSCSYEEYCQLVSERLNIRFLPKNAYKLIDIKPFVGAIHEKELKGYDFWGMGDLDLIYGDLTLLVNEENLKKYHLITTHNYHIAGHFCLCRNNDYYRHLCFKIKDWMAKLQDDEAFALDEGEWSGLACPQVRNIRRLYRYLFKYLGVDVWKYRDRMNSCMMPHKLIKEYWTSPQPHEGQSWVYDLSNGKIIDDNGRELPYLHFLFFKKTKWLETERYWREGYWTLDNEFEEYKKIVFSIDEVKGVLR